MERAAEPTNQADASWVRFGRALLVVAAVLVVAREATLGAHSDDLRVIAETRHLSYGELVRAPFFGSFYRPLVVLLVKVSSDVFGDTIAPLRILNAILLIAGLSVAQKILSRRVGPMAATIALLCFFGSPFTFVTAVPFAVGIADLIVAIALLESIDATLSPGRPSPSLRLIVLSMIAILAKESGLLVAVFGIISSIQRRSYWTAMALISMAASFIVWRSNVVPHVDFTFDSGFLFAFLDVSQLRHEFGRSPLEFYVYSALASLSTVITSEPNRGYFKAEYSDLALVPVIGMTTLVIGRYLIRTGAWRREYLPFIGLIVANALFGHMYVRPRIMFAAYTGISLLLGFAVDRLLESRDRPFGVRPELVTRSLFVGWAVILCGVVVTVVRLPG